MFAHKELWFITLIALGIFTIIVIGVIKTNAPGVIPPVSEVCRSDQECGNGFYCRHGVCDQFAPDISCQADDECRLINSELRFSCCYAGACEGVDYAQEKWIAVNAASFFLKQKQFCPSKEQCGPAPACPSYLINDAFNARCVSGVCQKLPAGKR